MDIASANTPDRKRQYPRGTAQPYLRASSAGRSMLLISFWSFSRSRQSRKNSTGLTRTLRFRSPSRSPFGPWAPSSSVCSRIAMAGACR